MEAIWLAPSVPRAGRRRATDHLKISAELVIIRPSSARFALLCYISRGVVCCLHLHHDHHACRLVRPGLAWPTDGQRWMMGSERRTSTFLADLEIYSPANHPRRVWTADCLPVHIHRRLRHESLIAMGLHLPNQGPSGQLPQGKDESSEVLEVS